MATHPFNNNVLAMPVPLAALGLTVQDSTVAIGVASGPAGTAENAHYVTVDVKTLSLDTDRKGHGGVPVFGSNEPLVLHPDPNADMTALPKLLVLHHTNVADKTMEIADLSSIQSDEDGNLALSGTGPQSATAGESFQVTLTVDNDSAKGRQGVTLAGAVEGATPESAAPGKGACTVTDGLTCELGALDAGESVPVVLTLTAPDTADSEAATVMATAHSALGCEGDTSDNDTAVSVTMEGAAGTGGAGGTPLRGGIVLQGLLRVGRAVLGPSALLAARVQTGGAMRVEMSGTIGPEGAASGQEYGGPVGALSYYNGATRAAGQRTRDGSLGVSSPGG